jgi:alpha-amylase
MLTAPGVPFVYYGEEVGEQGEVAEDWNRRPMQWSADSFSGFSTVSPWKPLAPAWQSYNVAEETGEPASLLSHYRDLIRARNQHAALRVGDVSVVSTYNDALYSILRVSEEEAVLVLVNLRGAPVTDYALRVEQSSLAEGTYTPFAILGEGEFADLPVSSGGRFALYIPVAEVPPYATYILQLHLNTP